MNEAILLPCVLVFVHERVYSFIYPQMQTRCLTAVDLAEHVAIQIQFWLLNMKASFDTDLIWLFLFLQCIKSMFTCDMARFCFKANFGLELLKAVSS